MKCVDSLSVCGSDLESVAMIQVFPPASVHWQVTVYSSVQVSQKDFTLVKEITVQSEEPATSEGWDESRKQRLSSFLYSPEAYAIEQELKSPCEDAVHQIMNCPVAHDGTEKTLGHAYDVVYMANCQGQDVKSDAADEPSVKRVPVQRITQKVTATYGIAVLYDTARMSKHH